MSLTRPPIDMFELENNFLAEVVDRSDFDGDSAYTVYLFNGKYYLCRDHSDQVFPCRMNDQGEWEITGPGLIKPGREIILN
jgi:hypothetical protein